MRGKVLDFDQSRDTGVISGDDGNRYYFETYDVNGDVNPRSGNKVDFEAEENRAVDIYIDNPLSGGVPPKVVAALLAFFLGAFGIHKFYLGFKKQGIIMLLVFFFGFILLGVPSMIIGIIALVEAILYISKSDEEFERLYIEGHKGWF